MNEAMLQEALEQHRRGNLRGAETLYKQILAADPKHPDALHLMGVLANEAGKPELAVPLIQEAISILPNAIAYHGNLGNVFERLGRFDEAEDCYLRALSIDPTYADGHYNLGLMYYRNGNLEDSILCFQNTLKNNPTIIDAWNNLGVALMDKKLYKDAITCFCSAIQRAPYLASAHANLGNALQHNGDYDEAIGSLTRALELDKNQGTAWNTLGVTLDKSDRPQAIECFQKALECNPDHQEALNNLGRATSFAGNIEKGIFYLTRAINLRPDDPDAHWNRALANLLHGRYLEGWREHEWRWKVPSFPSPQRNFAKPQWQGENLNGLTILVHAEQGIGDTIQFARFLPLLAAKGAKIVLEVFPPLCRLFTGMESVIDIVSFGQPLPEFDVHCPFMSLPYLLGTTIDSIPAPVSFPAVRKIKSNAVTNGSLKVGLAWAGNPNHGTDYKRSISIEKLVPLGQAQDVSFFCAFKGPAAEQRFLVSSLLPMEDLCARATDFLDTAEAIQDLDLIISVDTAVAHLAATMGKKVWLLVPNPPDWRWMLGREDSPWYPSLRIFRQDVPGDWVSVISRVGSELTRLIEERAVPAE